MRVLLDTCVVSEVRKSEGNVRVRMQVEAISPEDLFLSVVTVGELTKGIALLSEGRRKRSLTDWLRTLQQSYASRVLGVDIEVAQIWGELTAVASKNGRTVAVSDGLIAATAIRNGLRVMTRNTSDFEETGALLMNPWEAS